MPIGKSKISDMDFGSFENTIDKNIETDKASDKFDQQLQAYKDAGNSLTSAKSELETAASSLKGAKDNLDKATDKADAVTKAIDSFIAKVRDINFYIYMLKVIPSSVSHARGIYLLDRLLLVATKLIDNCEGDRCPVVVDFHTVVLVALYGTCVV